METPETKTPSVPFDFGEALRRLKDGKRVHRKAFNGRIFYIEIRTCGQNPKIIPYPHVYARSSITGDYFTWTPSFADLMAEDWVEVTGS